MKTFYVLAAIPLAMPVAAMAKSRQNHNLNSNSSLSSSESPQLEPARLPVVPQGTRVAPPVLQPVHSVPMGTTVSPPTGVGISNPVTSMPTGTYIDLRPPAPPFGTKASLPSATVVSHGTLVKP